VTITIFFRGVALYAPKSPTGIEVLFPEAEGKPPGGSKTADGKYLHADGTRANPHFAGLLVPDGKPVHRSLQHKLVTFSESGDVEIEKGFGKLFPSLRAATDGETFSLRLHSDPKQQELRVATRIRLSGGKLEAVQPPRQPAFGMHTMLPRPIRARPYSLYSKWTTPAEKVTISIASFSGQQETEIELNKAHSVAHFYCYDRARPTVRQLTEDDFSKLHGLVTDDDFKWLFQLMDRTDGSTTWKKWLRGKKFPAPFTTVVSGDLTPVFTCFQTFWKSATAAKAVKKRTKLAHGAGKPRKK
jgi:hypothetical protein